MSDRELADPLADLKAEIAAQENAGDAEADEALSDTSEHEDGAPEKDMAEMEASEDGSESGDDGDGEEKDAKEEKPEGKGKRGKPVPPERFNEVYGKYHAERQRAEAAEAEKERLEALVKELSAAKKTDEQKQDEKPQKSEAEIRAEVEQQLRQQFEEEAKAKEFNEASNQAYENGIKKFGQAEFEESLQDLQRVGLSSRVDVVQTALETGNAEQVLFLMGQDVAEAERIMSLSPVKMAIEMAKLAASRPRAPRPETPVSKASDPIKPVRGANAANEFDLADPNADMNEWVRNFDKLMEKRAS